MNDAGDLQLYGSRRSKLFKVANSESFRQKDCIWTETLEKFSNKETPKGQDYQIFGGSISQDKTGEHNIVMLLFLLIKNFTRRDKEC